MGRNIATSVPPWHLWGQEKNVVIPASATSQNDLVVGQLTHIEYKRPDTWCFVLSAEPQYPSGIPAGPINLDLIFQLRIGVGLVNIVMPSWATFSWTLPGDSGRRFAVSLPQLPLTTSGTPQQNIDHVVAQSIFLDAKINVDALTAGIVMNVSSLWAPRSHIRPDWFDQDFNGGELGGK